MHKPEGREIDKKLKSVSYAIRIIWTRIIIF